MRTPLTTAVLLANACLLPAAFAQVPSASEARSVTPATNESAGPAAPAAGTATTATTATQANDRALDPIVVTAARAPQPLNSAIPQTTVYTAADIAASNQTDLPSLLQSAAGAQIVRNGGPGSATSLFLRGANSNQTLFLIDGVRMDSASLATAQLEQIMLDQVDHVEVVNGNVSSLYGSGAIGGVVQVFTKDGGDHPPRFNFQTELGSYHTQRQQVGVNGALDADGRTTFNITLARFRTDGFSANNPNEAPGANPNANGYSNTSVGATIKHRFGDNWDAGVRLYEATGRLSYDNSFGLPSDLNDTDNRVRSLSAFANGKLTDRWTTHLIVAQGDDQSTNLLNGDFSSRFNTRSQQLSWQNEFALAAGQKIVFGYERLNESLDSDEYAPPERHVNSGFVGYEGRFGASQFQFNLRRDQYSDFGGANSYYAGYGYNFDAHWKVLASISDAFRAPSFNDLYFPFFGDPNLKPEQSHSIEAGLQYSSDKLGVARVTAFQTRYTNLITASEVSPDFFLAANVGRAKVQGIETSWRGQLGGTDVRASFTLQNPIDESGEQDLVRRARRFGSVSASRRFGDWNAGVEWQVSGARDDGGNTLGGYGVINLTARYQVTKSWFVAARIDNLTNKNYELAYSYNTPGRGAYVTVGWMQQ